MVTPASPGCGTPGTSWTRYSGWWGHPPRTPGPGCPGSLTIGLTSSATTGPSQAWVSCGLVSMRFRLPSTWRVWCCSHVPADACQQSRRWDTDTSVTSRPPSTASGPGRASTACPGSPSVRSTTGRRSLWQPGEVTINYCSKKRKMVKLINH